MAPVQLIHESDTVASNLADALIHPETQDLRLEAQFLTDFLTDADLSAAWESKAAQGQVVKATEENEAGEKVAVEVLPGWVVAASIDEDDLYACFEHYLESFADRVFTEGHEENTLLNKTLLAQFGITKADSVGEATGHKRGWARKAQKAGGKARNNVVRQMLAMVKKGVLKRAPKGEGDFGGDYKKGKGYKTGGSNVGKMAAQKFKKSNKGKIARAAKKAGVKAESEGEGFNVAELDEYATFGLGVPVEGALYTVGVVADADARVVAEAKKKPPFGKKAAACDDEEDEEDDMEESTSAKRGARLAKGILSLHEGQGMHAHTKTDDKS